MSERRLPHLANRFVAQQNVSTANTTTSSTNNFNNLHYAKEALPKVETNNTYDNQTKASSQYIQKPSSPIQNPAPQNQNQQPAPVSPSLSSQVGRKKAPHKIDVNSVPRPFISSENSYKPLKYTTSNRAVFPPQSHQYFVITEDGNAGPRHIRASSYNISNDPSVTNNTQFPFGIIVQPFADTSLEEEEVPLVYPTKAPFRCSRCKAYVNPFFIWVDNGSRAVCNICKFTGEVPNEYFSSLDDTGKRKDRYERPELIKGCYEFVAPPEYLNKPLCENYIMICIELTTTNILNGVFNQVISSLQSLLDHIQCPEKTNLCIMTFDQYLNFYNIPQDLAKELQIVVVGELEDSCVPLPVNKLFVNVKNQREQLDYLLEKITKFGENLMNQQSNSQNQTPSAVSASLGSLLLSAGSCFAPKIGRILVFSSQMPTIGYAKLKRRDDYKLIGTEKEKTLYLPANDLYEKMGKTYLENRISLDLFIFNNNFYDLATISPLCAITGGSLYYYPRYNGIFDGEKLHYDLARNLTRYCGMDVIMTVRTSAGIILNEYVTGNGKVPVRDLELSSVDADKTITIYLKQEEKINEPEAFIQYAILYSNPYGQRVIRVINLTLQVTNNMSNIFKLADVDCILSLLIRKYLKNMQTGPLKLVKEGLMSNLVNILHSYRLNCGGQTSAGQLILPDALKLLPIYFLSLFKQCVLRFGNDIRPDDRIYECFKLMTAGFSDISGFLYPKLYPIHTFANNENELTPGNIYEEHYVIVPSNLPLSIEKIDPQGVFLIDNNETIYVYLLKNASPHILRGLLGVDSFSEVMDIIQFPSFEESEYNQRVLSIIDQLRKKKNGSYQNIRIVTEKDPILDQYLLNLLIEDEIMNLESYPDFLCKIHSEIQKKLS